MFKTTLGNTVVVVKFRRETEKTEHKVPLKRKARMKTECFVVNPETKEVLLHAVSINHPLDEPNREAGRRYALLKITSSFSREDRVRFFQEYKNAQERSRLNSLAGLKKERGVEA